MKLHFSSNVASESALSFDNFSFSLVIQDKDVSEIRSPRTYLVNTAARNLVQFLPRVPRTSRETIISVPTLLKIVRPKIGTHPNFTSCKCSEHLFSKVLI